QQYAKNAADGSAVLNTVDTTLQSVNTRLQRVRDLVLQASSTGSNDETSRKAIAAEVTSLRQELVGLANTNYNGRPLFGGTTASATAFDATTYAYLGDAGTMMRRLDSAATIEVGASGPAVVGSGPPSLFALLDDIAANAVNDTDALAGNLQALDGRMS